MLLLKIIFITLIKIYLVLKKLAENNWNILTSVFYDERLILIINFKFLRITFKNIINSQYDTFPLLPSETFEAITTLKVDSLILRILMSFYLSLSPVFVFVSDRSRLYLHYCLLILLTIDLAYWIGQMMYVRKGNKRLTWHKQIH